MIFVKPSCPHHEGAQWLSGRALDSRPKGRGFEPHRRHCVVSLSKNINPSLVLVQPRTTRHFITEKMLMGRKESYQTNKRSTSAVPFPENTNIINRPNLKKCYKHVNKYLLELIFLTTLAAYHILILL